MPRKKIVIMEPIFTPLGTKIYNDTEEKRVRLSDNNKRRIETGIKKITYDKQKDSFEIHLEPIKTSEGCKLKACIVEGSSTDIRLFFREFNKLLERFGGNKAEAALELVSREIGISPQVMKKLFILHFHK